MEGPRSRADASLTTVRWPRQFQRLPLLQLLRLILLRGVRSKASKTKRTLVSLGSDIGVSVATKCCRGMGGQNLNVF
jgi:hypothetical protein